MNWYDRHLRGTHLVAAALGCGVFALQVIVFRIPLFAFVNVLMLVLIPVNLVLPVVHPRLLARAERHGPLGRRARLILGALLSILFAGMVIAALAYMVQQAGLWIIPIFTGLGVLVWFFVCWLPKRDDDGG